MKRLLMIVMLMLSFVASAASEVVNKVTWYYETFSDYTGLWCARIIPARANQYDMYEANKYAGDLEIPDRLGGYRVTSIGESAFSGCTNLTSVKIHSRVTSIRAGAFVGCTALKSFSVNSGNTAYYSTNGLLCTKSGNWLVAGVNGDVKIPLCVTSIGDHAFDGYDGLTSVTIPTNVTSIGNEAFSHCGKLGSVEIPESVKDIGEKAFWLCTGLTSLTIHEGVRKIRTGAFRGCSGLKSLALPTSLGTINEEVFGGCIHLEAMNIPDGVTGIGRQAFDSCGGLKSVSIPTSVKNIELNAFAWCSNLTAVVIPEGVRFIGNSAFKHCYSIESVTLPSSVTEIKDHAFEGCAGQRVFSVDPDNTVYCSTNGFLCSKNGKVLIAGMGGDATIPPCVTGIGECAFAECYGLNSITIPSSVTVIGSAAFRSCSRLVSVRIPSSVEYINAFAFESCRGLTSVTIPPSVRSIGNFAFEDCGGLRTVHVGQGDVARVKSIYYWPSTVQFVEIEPPSIANDPGATVTGDLVNGFVIQPSAGNVAIEVSIPQGVEAEKVTVEVSPKVVSVKPKGAKVKIVSGGADITEFLNVPAADGNGVVDLTKATVKAELVKEVLDVKKGAKIVLDAADPKLTTAPTRAGLFYQLREGTTIGGMANGDSKVGDGEPWSPEIKVKGGSSAFYSIGVGKSE